MMSKSKISSNGQWRLWSILIVYLVGSAVLASAQEIRTASSLFDQISQNYETIQDYSALITLEGDGGTQRGELFFLQPEYLRIKFSQPKDQEIVSDGEVFSVYIPQSNVILQQEYTNTNQVTGLGNPEGLRLMKERYSIAYLSGAELQPLSDSSDILVHALRLTWKNKTDGFRQIILYVSEDLLIRKIEATSANYKELILTFESITVNSNLTEPFFQFDSPGSASIFENFLFE